MFKPRRSFTLAIILASVFAGFAAVGNVVAHAGSDDNYWENQRKESLRNGQRQAEQRNYQ